MNDTIALIVEIPKAEYELIVCDEACGLNPLTRAIARATPLSNNSERAEVQAYFDGQAYGWEEGRKALIDDVKAEIETDLSWEMFDEYGNETALHEELWEILDNIGKGE